MTNHIGNDKDNILEPFSELEKCLDELSCFISIPTNELIARQIEDLGDLITRTRYELLSAEKKITKLKSKGVPEMKDTDHIYTSLSNYKAKFRKLALDSKKKSDRFHQESLLGNTRSDLKADRRQSKQINAARAATSITEGLKRTSTLLGYEIKKSETSYQVLAESSKVLQETRQTYGIINDVMQQSRTLLSGLEWSQLLDYVVLFIGFLIFSITVAYVVAKRTYLPIPSPLSIFYLLFYIIQKSTYILSFTCQALFRLSHSQEASSPVSSIANVPSYTSVSVKHGVCLATSYSAQFQYPTCGLTPP